MKSILLAVRFLITGYLVGSLALFFLMELLLFIRLDVLRPERLTEAEFNCCMLFLTWYFLDRTLERILK